MNEIKEKLFWFFLLFIVVVIIEKENYKFCIFIIVYRLLFIIYSIVE